MKILLLLLIAISAATTGFAQDIIVKKTGEEIQAKVQELTPEAIKYRRFDYLDGPVYSIWKREVFMIRYENGTKDLINPSSPAPSAYNQPQPAFEVEEVPAPYHMKLNGPRLGVTLIAPGKMADRLKEDYNADPVISQFGWQFETRIFHSDNGAAGLVEFVPLIGGLEQGLFLPSATALIGLRSRTGYEFGVGPNVSLAGAGLAVAAGTTITSGNMNFPINFAAVPGRGGARYSMLIGFNYRTR